MAFVSDSEKLRKKKVLKIQRSLQKEEADHKLDDFSASDNEEIDFSKEIHPIGYYINDREKMIEQMFSVIKGEKLKKMLPPVLKKYNLEEIKADCLVHLLGMSKKRIFAILQGRDLNSSSDSETDSTNSVLGSDSSEEPQITSSTHIKSDVEEIDDTLDISISKNDLDALITEKRAARPPLTKKRKDKSKQGDKLQKKIKTERSPSLIEISDDEEIRIKKKKDDKRSKKKTDKKPKIKHKHVKEKPKKAASSGSSDESSEKDVKDNKSISDPKKGKSLLEILELEMRARAIRALLESAPNQGEPVPVINIKSEPEESEEIEKTVPTHTPTDPSNENVDESDSLEVVEVIDKNDDDAIVILDDADEQIGTEPKKDLAQKQPEKISSEKIDEPPIEIDSAPESDVTWSQRWAESKGVKNVIQNSKLCANIRKRMRFARMLKQKQQRQENQSKDNPILSEMSAVEEGSVDQLELIKSLEEARKQLDEALGTVDTNELEKAPKAQHSIDGKAEEKDQSSDKVTEAIEKDESSKPTFDVEIIEKNIECHIDLTDG